MFTMSLEERIRDSKEKCLKQNQIDFVLENLNTLNVEKNIESGLFFS